MSTTVTFAGNVTGDPELLYACDGTPFAGFRVVVNRRFQNEVGEWVDGEPTGRNVTIYGTAANPSYDFAGRGDRVVVHGQLRSEAWRDRETGRKRTKQVVTDENLLGEVGLSLQHGVAGLERQTVPAATTEN